MKSFKLEYYIIGGLIILNLALLYKIYSGNLFINTLRQTLSSVNYNNSMVRGQKNKIVSDYQLAYADWGKSIDNYNEKFSENTLGILVFRIHSNNCNECVSQSLKYINNFISESYTSIKIVISVTGDGAIELIKMYDLELFEIQYEDKINLDIDLTTKPYFFLVNKKGIVSDIFIPEYDIMELFEAYINSIFKRYSL